MRWFLVIALITCTVFLNACKKSSDARTQTDIEVTIDDCVNSVFDGDYIRICFDSVISDSRCPANAMCVWQGTAVAKFLFTKNDEPHPLTLATISWPGVYTKDTIVSGYKIEFITLNPYPGLPAPPPPGNELRAELKVTKL